MNRLGFCVSYDEIGRYKQCAVQSDDTDLPLCFPLGFTQWSADNIDHNLCTLDGHGTFHGMGIISMTSSTSAANLANGHFTEEPLKRLPRVKVGNMTKGKGIPVVHYRIKEKSALSEIQFQPIADLNVQYTAPRSVGNVDVLWHAGWLLSDDNNPRWNWSGFMQTVTTGASSGCADIRVLPIIDLNPNDLSCIYSTLTFILAQAKLLNIATPCITFDQPLWLKAVEIISSDRLNVVCRLGPFHIMMSFLGSIGTVMGGSGLVEALECCYGPNCVGQMISGKAVSRAVRGHFLVESALTVILLRHIMGISPNDSWTDGCLSGPDVEELKNVYNNVIGNRDCRQIKESELCTKVQQMLCNLKAYLCEHSRTAGLWCQYLEYVSILKSFIRAERTADWSLHLMTFSKMLNLFAATGHNSYAKSGRLYLQMMLQLPEKHPLVHEQLSNGFHAVRRSDRYWAGLSTDLTIEQVLMRAVKGRGGLTHGRGMTDSVRLTWVRSLHKCGAFHGALLSLLDLDQTCDDTVHADVGRTRTKRDLSDLQKILEWFEVNNPFDVADGRLRSLVSGIAADEYEQINCDKAEAIGSHILESMDNVPYTDVTMKRADQVKNMLHLHNAVSVEKKSLNIDSSVLFNRLLLIAERSSDIEQCFTYELSHMPAALFKDSFMRKADKSKLMHELVKGTDISSPPGKETVFVIDGGNLLHAVKWQQGVTYADVALQYLSYVKQHFGCQVTIVFDGYCSGPSVKDHEHLRRAAKTGPDVLLEPNKTVYRNQAEFLANELNKKQFIEYLMGCLAEFGYTVLQAVDDADTLIVHTALQLARNATCGSVQLLPVTLIY